MKTFNRDTLDIEDYCWDWELWLDGDIIQSADFIIPTGLTKVTDTKTDTTATVWLSGGTINIAYQVSCTIVTVGGRTKNRSALFAMKDL